MMFFRSLAASCLLLIAGASAQNGPAPVDQSQSVIRATTRLVVVDLVAVDANGKPVPDLKQEDFTVLEEGVPQKISTFSFQHPDPQAHTPAAQPVPSGIITNAPQYGTTSTFNIILLDSINTDFSAHAYAQDMLAKYLGSGPEIQPTAVFALGSKLVMLHDFTTDSRALREVVANFKSQGPTHIPDVRAAASPFTRQGSFQTTPEGRTVTFRAIHSIALAMAGYPGRKNLIWISEGFPINLFPEFNPGDGTVLIEDFSALAEKIADELMNAQIALYPIDAAGVTVNDRFSAHTAMISMAQRTGGKTFYNRNDIEMGVRTSIDDGSTYYSLSYYPQNRTWDNKFRKIVVKVARPGMKLQYREGYYAQPPNLENNSAAIGGNFSNALVPDAPASSGVLFQAAVIPPSEKTQNKVVVSFGVNPRTVAFEKKDDGLQHASISCVVWAYANVKKGDPVRAEGPSLNAALKPEEYSKMMKSYFPCQKALALKPGAYTLRLGVVDHTTGLIGTATASVSVP
ncbi:MAG TPA: VWA domain-containing protein [Candidatus Saccharimonadales bacterium]|jgi:VWFA-related protein|nr:VWA domain-containing protein [Candidatus Saccharimonadales bacterium]